MKKARIRATRKIVFVEAHLGYPGGYKASDGETYRGEELEIIVDCEPDYWTRLEHQAAIAAMGGLCGNTSYDETAWENMAEDAIRAAHALVEKLKESK